MKLFTYGTLMPSDQEVKTLVGYKMYDMGWYPGVIRTGNLDDTVKGCIVDVRNDEHLAQLDRYEGCNGNNVTCLYHRINLVQGEGEPIWLYVYNDMYDTVQDARPEVPEGDWLSYKGSKSGSNSQLIEKV